MQILRDIITGFGGVLLLISGLVFVIAPRLVIGARRVLPADAAATAAVENSAVGEVFYRVLGLVMAVIGGYVFISYLPFIN